MEPKEWLHFKYLFMTWRLVSWIILQGFRDVKKRSRLARRPFSFERAGVLLHGISSFPHTPLLLVSCKAVFKSPPCIPYCNFYGYSYWSCNERYPRSGPVLPFSTSASLCETFIPPSDKTELLLYYETANPAQKNEGDGAKGTWL